MIIRRRVVLGLWFVGSLLLDTAVLPWWNLFNLVPFVLLALVLTVVRLFSLQEALVMGAIGGLAEDMICHSSLGLSSALCLLCAAAYYALEKGNGLKPLVSFVCVVGLAFLSEAFRAGAAWLIGMRFAFGYAMIYGAFPRALLTGAWAMALQGLLRPLLKGQVDR